MADTDAPGGGEQPRDPGELTSPGGCPCGVSGCLVLVVVLSAALVGTMVVMALLRPELGPPPLPAPR